MEIRSKNTGTLFLLPSFLSDASPVDIIPEENSEIMKTLRFFIVEEIRSARRFIRKINHEAVIDDLNFIIFNEHSSAEDIDLALKPLLESQDAGLLSEAGLPCVADPGNLIVAAAHRKNIRVRPLSGPSSIMLALMASGLNGQQFTFHGYLQVEKDLRIKKIREIEATAIKTGYTQIFIEAPYRNLQMLDTITSSADGSTMLCIATDLTGPEETVISATVREWKKIKADINKKPSVFLLGRSM